MSEAQLSMRSSEAAASAWLAQGGVDPSRKRIVLAQLLIGDGQHRHVSAEGLHQAARAGGENVSVATVYSALRTFAAAGLLREIRIDASRSYFDTRTDDHAHFYWTESGRFEDAPEGSVSVESLPTPPAGTRIDGVEVVIRLSSSPAAVSRRMKRNPRSRGSPRENSAPPSPCADRRR